MTAALAADIAARTAPSSPLSGGVENPTDRSRSRSRSGRAGLSVQEAAARLEALRQNIRDAEDDQDRGAGPAAASRGAVGHVEEWASASFDGDQPPAGVLWSRVTAAAAARRPGAGPRLIVWIGDWCWIHPRAVDQTPENWLWLKTRRQVDRVWAVELCCRNPAVSVVVADGRGLSMAATRRLQLAARAGGVRVLLARTPEELACPSAAPVRGLVEGEDADGAGQHDVAHHVAHRAGDEPEASWPRRLHARGFAASAVAETAERLSAAEPAPPRRTASPPRWNARLLRRKGMWPTDDLAEPVAENQRPGSEPDLVLTGEGDGWVVEKRNARMVVRSFERLADRSAPPQAISLAG